MFSRTVCKRKEKLIQTKNKWTVDFWDALLAISAWIVLFDVLFDQIIDHQNLMGMMNFGLSQIVSALGLYLVCRALIEVIIRFDHGIWRWLSLAGLFVLFLAIRYVSKLASLDLQVSVVAVAALFLLHFWIEFMEIELLLRDKA